MATENLRFNGQTTLKLTKKGTIDARGGVGRAIKNQVTDMVNQALKANGIEPIEKGQIKQPQPESKSNFYKAGKWTASQMGKAMTIYSAISSGIRYNNALASGDEAKANKALLNGSLSFVTDGLGAIGGPWGLVASTTLSAIRGLLGRHIENQIQEIYDNRRLSYRLTNYDLSKYSTQTFNTVTQKWNAVDTDKVNRTVLGKVNIS